MSWGVLGYPGVSWGNKTDPENNTITERTGKVKIREVEARA